MDRKTALDIDHRVDQILREMGVYDPPIRIEDVIQHLKIHHSYYSLEDPGLLQELFHRFKLGAKKVTDLASKIKLQGLWLPDTNQILVDLSVVEKKRKWVNAHEVAHKIIPAHAQFLQADTAETLDPDYHDMLEEEANYGASSLIFLNKKFTLESQELDPCFKSVHLLHKRYQNTLTTTFRRFVQYGHPKPILGVISLPHWKLLGAHEQRCRHFIPSAAFSEQFSQVDPIAVLGMINGYMYQAKRGPVGNSEVQLVDDNGEKHNFRAESFYTGYDDVLTLIVYQSASKVLIG